MTLMTVRLPGVTDDQERTVNRLLAQLDAKSARNKVRQSYYDMRNALRATTSVIPPPYWKLGIVLGWSGKAVDILARRCNLDGFVWPDGDLASLGFTEFAEANRLRSEVGQATISSLIHATAFIVNTTGGDNEPSSLLHFKDAMSATGDWNPRRRGLENLLSVTAWDPNGQPTEFTLYLDGLTIHASRDGGGSFTVDTQEHAWGVPAEMLVYKPRLGRPFGSSRISRAVMSLQDQATRSVIRMEAHSDIYAIPDMWMLGATEAIFKNADDSTKAAWQVVMGRLKGVPDDPEAPSDGLARVDVKQFPSSDPEPHLKALRQQAQLFSGETSIPLTSLGVSDMSNPTSSDSYIASREDLIAEAEGATDDWSTPLRRALVRGLAIQNGVPVADIPPEWASIEANWRNPIYLSRAAVADAGMKQLTAIPWLAETEVGLELLGLDGQQIRRALADKRRAQGQQALTALSAAAQQVRGVPAG